MTGHARVFEKRSFPMKIPWSCIGLYGRLSIETKSTLKLHLTLGIKAHIIWHLVALT